MKSPPATYFIKKAAGEETLENAATQFTHGDLPAEPHVAGISSGSQKPGTQIRSSLSLKHVYEIAKVQCQGHPALV